MPSVSAVLATWSFGSGSPGLSKLWFQELLDANARQLAVDNVRALLNTLNPYMRTDWTIQVEQTVQNFDLATGQLSSESTAGTKPAAINGIVLASNVYQGGVGARILWRTGAIINGRKVVGRTFCIPLISFTGTGGTVASALVASMKTAITSYVGSQIARPAVWHKDYDRTDTTKPPVYVGGASVPIITGDMLLPVSSLRSRRY